MRNRKRLSSVSDTQHHLNSPFTVEWNHQLFNTDSAFDVGGAFSEVCNALSPVKVLPVIDKGVHQSHPELVQRMEKWSQSTNTNCCDPLIIEGGEASKNNFTTIELILESIHKEHLCRKSCVLAIGGGAALDVIGFAASIAHRGIPLVRMPTTTLSACDSGLGVKNGINYFGKKNFIGVFDPPFAVINDFSFLSTLDDRHWRSGLSEAVKVALIKDKNLFDDIESQSKQLIAREIDVAKRIILHSAELHLLHITTGGDPFEKHESRPLDFGHWSAHKLEPLTDFTLTHGEAVSIGLALDVTISKLLGFLNEQTHARILSLLKALHLPTSHPALANPELVNGLEEFREHIGGKLTLLMIEGIGTPREIHELDSTTLRQAIEELM